MKTPILQAISFVLTKRSYFVYKINPLTTHTYLYGQWTLVQLSLGPQIKRANDRVKL